jgi:hypothetical protein
MVRFACCLLLTSPASALYADRQKQLNAFPNSNDVNESLWLGLLDRIADVLTGDEANNLEALGMAFGDKGLGVVVRRLRLFRGGGGVNKARQASLDLAIKDAPKGYGFCNMHFGWVEGLEDLREFNDLPEEHDVVQVTLPKLATEEVIVVEKETLFAKLVKKKRMRG